MPSVPSNWSSAEDTRVPAKARLQETDSMRHHRFLQARNEENRSKGGEVACTGNCQSLNERWCLWAPPPSCLDADDHEPASIACAQLRVLPPPFGGGPLPKLLHQLTAAAFGRARPHAVTALRTAMSTASCAPWFNSRPEASTSIARSSVAGTSMFMSRSFAFNLTVAPASRHTRARVRSVGSALERRRPERGHAARCCPRQSRGAPHTHLASVIERGKRNLSRTNVRNTRGFTRNSAAVGDPCNTKLAEFIPQRG